MKRSVWKSLTAALALSALVGAALQGVVTAGASTAPPKNAYAVGFETFEPTLGASSKGDLYFSTTPSRGVAIGWRASIAKSIDLGRTWKDIGPTLPTGHSNPPETNDPYIYVDPGTDRVFTFHMAPALLCSVLSFSDDGGKTWTSNPRGCSPNVVWDHQTIVAAKPRNVETIGYPNVLHQCVNAVYAAKCATSLDGGLTWGPSVPAYVNEEAANICGAQHGHLAAGPKGHVYLPTSRCGTKPRVYISGDDGLTWRESVISNKDTPFVDPTVSVDSKGNLYAAFIDEKGWLYYATSKNNGRSWSKAIKVAKGYTTNMPVIVAGDPGKAAIAYPATDDLPKGYATKGYLDGPPGDWVEKAAWGANFTVTTNGLGKRPNFRTVVATGRDPIGRGVICENATRCAYLIDFIEAVLGPDGRPYAAFVDGCIKKCSRTWKGKQIEGTGVGVVTTLSSGPRLCKKVCWRYKGAGRSGIDITAAYEYATSPAGASSSLEHAGLSPEEEALRDEATRSRLKAVSGT